MSDSVTDLERELKRLVPRALAAGASGRILGRIRARRRLLVFRHVAAGLAAAAVVAAVGGVFWWIQRLGVGHTGERPALAGLTPAPAEMEDGRGFRATDDVFRPVFTGTVLVDEMDEGVTMFGESSAVRRVRCRLLDQMRWHNAGRGVTFTATTPREEVIWVSLPTD